MALLSKMLVQGNNLRLRDEGGSRGWSSNQDQKTRTVGTCWINPGGLSMIFSCLSFCRVGEGSGLSGTGDSQRESRESIRANHSQFKPLFL